MKIRKLKWRFVGLLLLCAFLLPADVDIRIRQAAQKDLSRFLQSIKAGDEPAYGFSNRDEFKRIILGRPYQLITLNRAAGIISTVPGSDYIRRLNVWRFPLICDGKIRSLLTVAKVSGQWQAVALGATVLSKEINDLEMGLLDSKQNRQRSILRLFQLGVDFIILSDTIEANNLLKGEVIPLKSSRKFFSSHHLRVSKIQFKDLIILINKNYHLFVTHASRGGNEY